MDAHGLLTDPSKAKTLKRCKAMAVKNSIMVLNNPLLPIAHLVKAYANWGSGNILLKDGLIDSSGTTVKQCSIDITPGRHDLLPNNLIGWYFWHGMASPPPSTAQPTGTSWPKYPIYSWLPPGVPFPNQNFFFALIDDWQSSIPIEDLYGSSELMYFVHIKLDCEKAMKAGMHIEAAPNNIWGGGYSPGYAETKWSFDCGTMTPLE